MKIRLNLTKDHLKLIPFVLINNDKDDVLEISKERLLTVQSSLLDDVSLVLGLRDKAIPNTQYSADGIAFPTELEDYMFDVYNYVCNNIYAIETLIHQFVVNGGLTEGVYECDSQDMIWSKL